MIKKTIRIVPAILIALATLVIGAASAWLIERDRHAQETASVVLANEIEMAGLCVNSLKLTATGDSGRLARALEQRLDSAVVRASDLVREGARFDFPTPNFEEAMKRAAAYYAADGNEEQRRRAEIVRAALKASNQ